MWPGEAHGDFDSRLNVTVRELRESLGDNAERPRYVQTVRKTGYRFIAPVRPAIGSLPARVVSPGLVNPALRSLLLGLVLGMAILGLAQTLLSVHQKPVIEKISAIEAEQEQQIRIVGRGLGRHAPFAVVGLEHSVPDDRGRYREMDGGKDESR